jgi:phospholipid transport system substrate-binding protein
MYDSTTRAAFLLIAILALPVAADPGAISEPVSAEIATARIEGLHANLLDVMKNAVSLGYEGREEKLRAVIPGYFDIDFMARKSLGSHWRSADEDARNRYLEAFTRFMVANYAGRFDGFSGQSFETIGEEVARHDTMVVKTVLRDPSDEDVELNYRMRMVDGTWKVIDVYLDGTVSELALRRSEFVSIVKREDIEALIVALDAKIAKLASGGEG